MAYDPTEAVTFDLQYGHVHLDGAPTRVMVPSDALVALCRAAPPAAAAAFGDAMGHAMGKRAAGRIAGDGKDRLAAARGATLETVVTELAAEFALVGIGALGIERWGKVLVLIHDQSPLGEDGDGLIAEILQSAFSTIGGKAARIVRLQRVGVRARLAVLNAATADEARARLGRGESWGSVLADLHRNEPLPA
ncbi:MAG: hypothetical protein IT373_09960 [Polyangiaceae bacterium]|nr:hypothetical protein [Polyangiaceae bacterium]